MQGGAMRASCVISLTVEAEKRQGQVSFGFARGLAE
jgi:hypothetical protein